MEPTRSADYYNGLTRGTEAPGDPEPADARAAAARKNAIGEGRLRVLKGSEGARVARQRKLAAEAAQKAGEARGERIASSVENFQERRGILRAADGDEAAGNDDATKGKGRGRGGRGKRAKRAKRA